MSTSSEAAAAEMQSVLERLISSRNRDLSLFIPFLLGLTDSQPSDHDHDRDDRRERIVLINPMTQGMVVIEGARLEDLFREKCGQPPASKSAIEAMAEVQIKEGEEGECVICLDEWVVGESVKEMPCKHKFHGGCIEKWLKLHGSCPVCRHVLPAEEAEKKPPEEERERRREIWVSFSFGGPRRRTEVVNAGNDNGDGNGNGDGDGEVN